MINQFHLRKLIIKPVLEYFDKKYKDGFYSFSAENLLIGIAAIETLGGYWLKQNLGAKNDANGVALGIWQMEEKTYIDCWKNFILKRPELHKEIKKYFDFKTDKIPDADNLIYNLRYACFMSRLYLWRMPPFTNELNLPQANDLTNLAIYYKKYYNTAEGKGSVSKFIADYERYING